MFDSILLVSIVAGFVARIAPMALQSITAAPLIPVADGSCPYPRRGWRAAGSPFADVTVRPSICLRAAC